MDRATGPTEVGQGWRDDPWQTHEFRYYSGGAATHWVSSSGVITEEIVVSVDDLLRSARERQGPPLALAPVVLPSPHSAEGWRVDPWHTHEFRYYSGGVATNWVSSTGAIAEETVVSVDELLCLLTGVDRTVTGRVACPPPVLPTLAPAPAPVPAPASSAAAVVAADAPRRGIRRASRAAGVIAALTLITLLVVLTATHGGQPVQRTAPRHTANSRLTDPTAPAAAPPVPTANSQLETWWTGTGQPDTLALATGLHQLGGPTGSSIALTDACRTFVGAVATAGSAAPAPMATIEREWQQTMATVNRVAGACTAGRYAQMSLDLQPASYTIHDLTAQVTSYLNQG